MKSTINFLLPVLIIIFTIGCYDTQGAANIKPTPKNNYETKIETLPSPLAKADVSSTPPPENKSDNLTASDLQNLKKWIGKYPVGENKIKENFFYGRKLNRLY